MAIFIEVCKHILGLDLRLKILFNVLKIIIGVVCIRTMEITNIKIVSENMTLQ